ncbi:LON peptidase substrate-binding domain-containing protein [Brytella acorum]|uniref:LON peptidase substrate-binding domain-containing protein n=1 Tax=Brytella acorum TaxID=2959299 RepID=UPI0025AE9653|nr:LON peptidase substrate-binding domain-containing protein [Brytella acorum]MDF3624714.1 LON peptidase substrate-binding domain-containing protein [Brytella acorum]
MTLPQEGFVHGGEDDVPRRIPRLQDITLADVPARVGLFPLPGALLLPGGKLPLNVFEPRYVALLEDALASNRLIGMIQPRDEEDDSAQPALHHVGCLGRITSFNERADGTFAMTLSGLVRFRILREGTEERGYRIAHIDASGFAADLVETGDVALDRDRLIDSLRRYLDLHNLHTSWNAIEEMEDDALMVVLPMLVPFTVDEKQSLLEAETIGDRAAVLISLLDDLSEADDPED